MGWTAPRTWVPGELETAVIFNAHVRDNLNYLKGNAGAVTISDELQSVVAAGGTLTAQGTANTSFGRFKMLAKRTAGTTVDYRFVANGNDLGEFLIFDGAAGAARLWMDNAGNLGVGATAPAGKFHVSGAGASAGAGIAINSVAAVFALQTIFAAGTVTRAALCLVLDRNNTGGGIAAPALFTVTPGGSAPTYTNSDTITVTCTAGGAITVQRTSGTNGTHDISMFVVLL